MYDFVWIRDTITQLSVITVTSAVMNHGKVYVGDVDMFYQCNKAWDSTSWEIYIEGVDIPS